MEANFIPRNLDDQKKKENLTERTRDRSRMSPGYYKGSLMLLVLRGVGNERTRSRSTMHAFHQKT